MHHREIALHGERGSEGSPMLRVLPGNQGARRGCEESERSWGQVGKDGTGITSAVL